MLGRSLRGAIGLAAWFVTLALLLQVILRLAAHDVLWATIITNTLTPHVYAPLLLVVPLAIWQRRWILGCMSGAVFALALFWTLEPYTRYERASGPGGQPFRIFSTNVLAWSSSTEGIVNEILASNADVVAVQELSPRWVEAFESARFADAYPYRIEEPREDAFGSGIYSRTPFLQADVLETPAMPIARATVAIDGKPIRIYSVHSPPPVHPAFVDTWSRGLAAVEAAARREPLPVVLAGDFNATQHSAWHARFLRGGFASSHDACGRPFATTWPNGMLRVPAIRLDHVFLSRELECLSVREGVGVGSDHKPVVVDLRHRAASRTGPGA